MLKEIWIVVSLLLFIITDVEGQLLIRGKILDESTHSAVPYANIWLPEIKKGTASDQQGFFQLKVPDSDSVYIQVSCIGYQPLTKCIFPRYKNAMLIYLKPKVQTIAEVVVIAKEKESLETSSVIDEAALRHIQPTSFADLMELIPGGVSQDINMTKSQLLSLREPIAASSSNNTSYDYNSSFGTAFLIDGAPMSNDAELQDVTGFSESTTSSPLFKQNTTGKGVDMRLITTDDIESVEIVRGIPSVRYGELTSGLVKIKRAYKKTPWKARFKANPGSKLFALGKGFALPNHQTLNVNIDYMYYMPDQRNLKVNYGRITGSVRYKNNIEGHRGLWSLKANVAYTGSFDETRIDPEIDHPETDTYKKDYKQFDFSSVINWQALNNSCFRKFEYRFSGSYTHTQNAITRQVLGRPYPITVSRTEGEFYGEYLPLSYMADFLLDGKPFYFNTSFNTLLNFCFLGLEHNFSVGGDYRYEKNFGKGEVYDPTRPLYVGTGRPRASKDIPSMQKLAFFTEDSFSFFIGENKLETQFGVRANAALNLSQEYTISNRFYFDPRLNILFSLPTKKLWGKELKIAFSGGYGWLTKFPGLIHLYPNLLYFDKVELDFYSNSDESLRQVYYKTQIIDLTNYSLKPNRNSKIELGVRIKLGQCKFNINAYYEEMKRGFKTLNRAMIMEYKKYDTDFGPSSSELTEPPTIDMFPYEDKKTFQFYSRLGNGAREQKKGIEYQFDLGRFEKIQSRISINGAWMKVKYDLSEPTYGYPSTIIVDEHYPYYGYYTWNKGKEYQQFNTNIRFDTQIDKLGLIFSTTIQNTWYTSSKYNPNSGMPEYYFDYDNNKYTYTEEDVSDPILKFLYDNKTDFRNTREAYEAEINFKVTKKIQNKMWLAFYVNRLIYIAPEYKNMDGLTVKRKAFPYFGMEFNFNL